jgi:RNA polymerase sigma-70 factor (sigma-E family)
MWGRVGSGTRFADLYEQYSPEAFRFAYLLVGDRATAEDLTQDAFVKVYGRWQDLRRPESFRAYLRRAIVNHAYSHLRSVRRERARDRRVNTPVTTELPDISARHDLNQAMAGLPIRQRAALVLRYYEDCTESQVADVLACSPAAAKALIARGIRALRDSVLEEGH